METKVPAWKRSRHLLSFHIFFNIFSKQILFSNIHMNRFPSFVWQRLLADRLCPDGYNHISDRRSNLSVMICGLTDMETIRDTTDERRVARARRREIGRANR